MDKELVEKYLLSQEEIGQAIDRASNEQRIKGSKGISTSKSIAKAQLLKAYSLVAEEIKGELENACLVTLTNEPVTLARRNFRIFYTEAWQAFFKSLGVD